jgi:Ca2+-binding RTX toxin-like protein
MLRAILATIVVLAFPSAAAAESTLTYTDLAASANDVVRVTNSTVQGYQVSYSAGCFFGCSFRIESLQGFDDQAAACTPITSPTSFSCDGDAGAGGLQVPGNVSVTGSAGGDSVEGNCFLASPALTVNAGDGDDRVTVSPFCSNANTINLEGGHDTSAAGGTVSGGAGNDTLKGGPLNDTLDGGAGRDTLDGQDGVDTLRGGPGRDLLVPGIGAGDLVEGGTDSDTASYEDRTEAVNLSLDAQANDGVAAESDVIAADVENLIGGNGDDTLTGGDGPNDIDGGDGGDVINPGGGPDFVDGGTGNDRINARDGAQDRIECGDGNDQAIIDEFDSVSNCEDVQASRELMPDVDADGVPAPADCDDRDARRRPGFIDKPGNGVDEDCLGGDAPFARIFSTVQNSFTVRRNITRVKRLRVLAVPEGATIELRCKGGKKRGCFKKVKRFQVPRGAEAKNIVKPVRKRKFKPRARVEVRVLAADSIGKVVQFTMRRRALPRSRTLCLAPGQTQPAKC